MKMIIEIWSDVVCPFCYIGKRRFESALSKFEHKDDIEVVWRSFQLYPSITSQPDMTIYEFMAEKNGITVAQIKEQYDFINEMATEVGLKYKLDKAFLLNTKNAHQLLQLARTEKKDSDAGSYYFKHILSIIKILMI